MSGSRDLKYLLENIEPRHIPGEYVFCSIDIETLRTLGETPLLVFRESEGVTVVVLKEIAYQHALEFEGTWGLVTLSVHSNLEAVGFLSAVSKVLADAEISFNVVSAFYHDHLFVPYSKIYDALQVLEEVSILREK